VPTGASTPLNLSLSFFTVDQDAGTQLDYQSWLQFFLCLLRYMH
jgi:hypothetical protein